MKKNEGGGQGLEAHDTSTVRTGKTKKSHVSNKTKKSPSSVKKPSPFRPQGGIFQSTETMYKCDATVKTTKSINTTTGLSLSGKSFDPQGNHVKNDNRTVVMPVLSHTVEKAIGGDLAFSQLDYWKDSGLNHRASCHVMVSNGATVDGSSLQCRNSTLNPCVVVLSFRISVNFTNVDRKLNYLIERIAEVYKNEEDGTPLDRFACLRILRNHSRYISALANLTALKGTTPNVDFVVEHRMTAPFFVSPDIVTAAEDPIFFGYNIEEDTPTGETHIHFELKEKDKAFTPVRIDSKQSFDGNPIRTSGRKSMFSDFKMGSIPENISFKSPAPKGAASAAYRNAAADDDDDSTIATDTLQDNQASRKQRPPKRNAAPANFKTTGLDDEDESTDSSWDDELGEDDEDSADAMDVDGSGEDAAAKKKKDDTEIEKLRKELDQMRAIFNGQFAFAKSQSQDSNEQGSKKSGAGSSKKKKNSASDTSVTSHKTTATRGTAAREEKRKTPTKKPDDGNDASA